ncbi:MAG: DUF2075 domain-containing protein [Pseudosphingobacterium sp.]|nr:DUF2075 domain-containing protein [Pseudosphingobacterium sp.]
MNSSDQFEINRYDFNTRLPDKIDHRIYENDQWPLVYILSDGIMKEAYVGETTDMRARMKTHLANQRKQRLTVVHLLSSSLFNKSATLDIESNLIRYLSGDGYYQLQNGNLGLANHNYYNKKELYWEIFKNIWQRLRTEGIAKQSLKHIDNSDLFKYSPYKSLSKDQVDGLKTIIRGLIADDAKNLLIDGGAGTGKTVLAIFLFKLIHTDLEDFNFTEFGEEEKELPQLVAVLKKKYPQPKMALVVPMASFRKTLSNVFKHVKGLKASMVIGPSEVIKKHYDIVLVDESHRLRRRVNLSGTHTSIFDRNMVQLGLDKYKDSELNWILLKSRKAVFFYDANQSIKPSDVKKEDFQRLRQQPDTREEQLKSQFRVMGGIDYVNFIDQLLSVSVPKTKGIFQSKVYEFLLFHSFEDMVSQIKKREQEYSLARLIAGYAWKWVSSKDPEQYDICIGDVQLRWNRTSIDWINSEGSIEEVGCIHTTQGYDLNYAGVIFGNEISYDKIAQRIVIRKENYHDKNGKNAIENAEQLHDFILNIYKTILLRGVRGTYIYVCDPDLRDYFAQYIPSFGAADDKEEITLTKEPDENAIPFYDLAVAAGDFSDAQTVGEVQYVLLPHNMYDTNDLFACKVVGESMNRIIPNGSICLFRKYSGGSRNGKIVLASATAIQDADFGSYYTIKEYSSKKIVSEGGWQHEKIILNPLSYDDKYKPIVLEEDTLTDFKVIGIFERVL